MGTGTFQLFCYSIIFIGSHLSRQERSLILDFEKLNIMQNSFRIKRSHAYIFGRYLALFVD